MWYCVIWYTCVLLIRLMLRYLKSLSRLLEYIKNLNQIIVIENIDKIQQNRTEKNCKPGIYNWNKTKHDNKINTYYNNTLKLFTA